MKSALLPSQKAILAMSRAQFLSYLRCSSADEAHETLILNCTRDKDIDKGETLIHNADDGKVSLSFANKLSVGVCIFRLDEMTLRPTVLLLRRSPWWRRRRIFTSAAGRQGAGEWELPGGKVSDDDFCISAAIERLVKEKTGLRVTKIMVMLSGVRWRAELKVLLWDEDEGGLAYNDSAEEDDEGGVEDGLSEDHGQKVDSGVNMDWDNTSTMSTATTTTTITIGDGEIGSTAGIEDGKSRGEEEIRALSDADVLGIRIPTSSPSPRSPHVPVTPDSASISPPPPPPKDNDRNDKPDKYDDGYAYQYGNDGDYKYTYDHDFDHDPSLEPAPLSLPSRTIAVVEEEKKGGRTLRRRDTASSTALPVSLLSPHGGVGCSNGRSKSKSERRNAQVIPYKILRKEYAQLNFTVLVDEDEGDGLPGFLYADSTGGSREKAGRGERGVYEYDALEWATCARVEKLPMSEDLRRVVLEGLAWMGELTGDFF
ncbi:hypothetical protein E0Z10_g9611 [Xylaria hypoxylon]|uniref:Nudix hydrolase domain-containing protein n=1 Tax=Xylaria hypoxylon TaxID=37992 RepID=A0A4Z0Y5S9_9PEZI|nr:hypothetical protein E0Z10_g9611 [Xylaria hypoxylon]